MKALLNDEGKKLWGYVFPKGEVPVKGGPFKALFEGAREMEVYLVDWAALTDGERDLILDHLKGRFGGSKEEVNEEILVSGLPLRAALVSCVTISGRYF